MLDVEALRLTDEEQHELELNFVLTKDAILTHLNGHRIADAQLAKALWGVQEWLNRFEQGPACCQPHSLEDMLLAAGIPRHAHRN